MKRGKRGEGYFYTNNGKVIFRFPVGRYPNGRTRYKNYTGETKEQAYGAFLREKDKNQGYVKGDNPYLRDYILWWMRVYKRDSQKIRLTSYTRMCSTVNYQIIPCIGFYHLSQLNKNIIQRDMVNALLSGSANRNGKPLAVSTVRKAVVNLKDCLNNAVEDGLITINPCKGVVLPKEMAKKKESSIRFFSEEEQSRFIKTARKTTARGYPVYKYAEGLILALLTGLRAGELCALQKSNFNFEKKYVKVSNNSVSYYDEDPESETFQKTVRYVEDMAKTINSTDRLIWLSDEAIECAEKLCSKCKKDTDYVLTGNSHVMTYYNLARMYRNICSNAEIENPKGLHTLRHTYASTQFLKGVDAKVISKMLGHSSVKFTYDTYIHFIEESQAVRDILGSTQKPKIENVDEDELLMAISTRYGISLRTVSQFISENEKIK